MVFPFIFMWGKKSLSKGYVEVKDRKRGEVVKVVIEDFVPQFKSIRTNIWSSWGLIGP